MSEAAGMPATPVRPPRPARRTDRRAATGGITLPGAIEYWPIERLKPAPNDPRIHTPQQINRLAASMLEFGFTAPILVDEKGSVVAGRGRLAAARKLGLERVPVVKLAHLSETQRRAYRLADNKLALEADWDPALLAKELRALEAQAFDLSAAGFSVEELRELEAAAQRLAAPPAPAPRGAAAHRILQMLEFDTQAQKDRFVAFLAWLLERSPGVSRGAALAAHAAAAMKRRGA